MLEDLHIKDFALINVVDIDFTDGFTVLTGETGAGKSILIGALSFLLGGKASTDQIRYGAKEAVVSGTIKIKPECKEAFAWLEEHFIELEDNRVLLRRVIKDSGKTAAWIQNTSVTRTDLADFTSFLFDIHGQHEHQSLMYPQNHRKYLDAFAGIEQEVQDFSGLYTTLVEKRKLFNDLNTSDKDKKDKIAMLSFAIEEIDSAKLKPFEDEDLAAEENKLSKYEQLFSDVESSIDILSGDGGNVVSSVKKLNQCLSHSSEFDKDLATIQTRVENLFYELSDVAEELKSYKHSLTFDPERLQEIQERSALIFKLKKKYSPSVNSPLSTLFEYKDNAQKQLDSLSCTEETLSQLAEEIKTLEVQVYKAAKILSDKRKAAATKMARSVVDVLSHLGMKNTQFTVQVELKPGDTEAQKCGPYGFDDVEFIFSANAGSPLRPLAKIASGGELSRVMLSLKTVLCSGENGDNTETLIFDEIDTGIGGEVAVSVGQHIQRLSKNHQIFCITHLASIAVCADTQIKIEKSLVDGVTTTSIKPILGEERIEEIARMLSGDSINESSLQHARSLLIRSE